MWKLLTGITGDETYYHFLTERTEGLLQRVLRDQRPVINRPDHFEELHKGKEESSHQIYTLQESVQHGAPFLVKKDTKNYGSSRQHSPITWSEHA